MYKWITLLYTGKQNNIVNKEYLIKKKIDSSFLSALEKHYATSLAHICFWWKSAVL